jgi:hypothetical protein
MRCIIAFICRTLLLTTYVVLGRYEHEDTPLDVVERSVVTCMQVCILGADWVLYELCAFVVRVLSRRATHAITIGAPFDDRTCPNTQFATFASLANTALIVASFTSALCNMAGANAGSKPEPLH